MAEKNGSGYRERVQFDEPLWHELEALSDHLRLKPADVIRMLTAIGVAQMKGLTMMSGMQAALQPVVTAEMEADVDRMVGGRGRSGDGSSSSGELSSGSRRLGTGA